MFSLPRYRKVARVTACQDCLDKYIEAAHPGWEGSPKEKVSYFLKILRRLKKRGLPPDFYLAQGTVLP
jgi:hypothetical protein